MDIGVIIILTVFLVCALVVAIQVFFFCPIDPIPLDVPPPPSPAIPPYELQRRVDQKLHTNGTYENLTKIHDRDTLLGVTFTKAGDLIVCDADDGLYKVDKDGEVTTLATHLNGEQIRFANDVTEAGDGSIYFTVTSYKYKLHDWPYDLLEAKPHGQLLKYDPVTNETSLVLDGLGYANGITISSDQEYLVVSETWRFRCIKYWLKGEMKGKVEVFADNLPGSPDNISVAPDGSFWIALVQFTSNRMRFVHSYPMIKRVLATYLKLFELIKATERSAMVINVGIDGTLIKRLDDPDAKVMGFVTSVLEVDGNLYFGSLKNEFVGMLRKEISDA